MILDLKQDKTDLGKKEMEKLLKAEENILEIEKKIKETKDQLKKETSELEIKLELKRLDAEIYTEEKRELIQQIEKQIETLNGLNTISKDDKKKINALEKDKSTLETQINMAKTMLQEIGGQITEEEAKNLILKKLYVLINQELERYLNAEKRSLIAGIEKLWDKYFISSHDLEKERNKTLQELNGYLKGLGYLG